MFHEMNEQQAQKAEQRHQDDKRRMKERREEMVQVLDQQVRAHVYEYARAYEVVRMYAGRPSEDGTASCIFAFGARSNHYFLL